MRTYHMVSICLFHWWNTKDMFSTMWLQAIHKFSNKKMLVIMFLRMVCRCELSVPRMDSEPTSFLDGYECNHIYKIIIFVHWGAIQPIHRMEQCWDVNVHFIVSIDSKIIDVVKIQCAWVYNKLRHSNVTKT